MSNTAPPPVQIPPMKSGGIFLTYGCPSECRHCLYHCSPRQLDSWMTTGMLERILDAMRREPLSHVHLSGGEPFARPDLLEDAVRRTTAAGIPVTYVQTNAFWCDDRARTTGLLRQLARAGLQGLYVSVSMFHNEAVPLWRSRICVEAAREVFGPDAVTLWRPGGVDLYGLMLQVPGDGTHTFQEYLRWAHDAGHDDVLPTMLADMIPRGRLLDLPFDFFRPHPPGRWEGASCAAELLANDSAATIRHFHFAPDGDMMMGCCAGIAPATVDDPHPLVTRESHPVFHRLTTGGPFELLAFARDEQAYVPRAGGYASKCDLCFDVRRHLRRRGGFAELRPAFVYEDAAGAGRAGAPGR